MPEKTIRIKPVAGIILAGIPTDGADVPAALAEEWIAAKLARRVDEPKKPAKPGKES